MEYRRVQGVDTILVDYVEPEVLSKYYVGGVSGFDKEGSPIWLDPFATIDSKGKRWLIRNDRQQR